MGPWVEWWRLESVRMARCIKIGAFGGLAAGLVVFLGYVVASWWVCTTLRECPAHWLPYLVIFGIGVGVLTSVGIVAATVLHCLYRMTRVS